VTTPEGLNAAAGRIVKNVESKNSHDICTWKDAAECTDCANQHRLHCRWDGKLLAGFLLPNLAYGIVAIFGLVVTGVLTDVWWMLILFTVFMVVFFLFLEIRILCSHCPFYAEDSKLLHCLANNGAFKIWHYRPGPMAAWEKSSLIIGFIIYGLLPLCGQAYGIGFMTGDYAGYTRVGLLGMVGIAVATLLLAVTVFGTLCLFFCPACINFSCPLNRVPREQVDAYLERNPVIKEAWEKAGYRPGAGDEAQGGPLGPSGRRPHPSGPVDN